MKKERVKNDFAKFAEENYGFKPSKIQLQIVEGLLNGNGSILFKARQTGKHTFDLAVLDYLKKAKTPESAS